MLHAKRGILMTCSVSVARDSNNPTYYLCHHSTLPILKYLVLVWLVSVLLQVSFQLFRLPVSDFHGSNGSGVRLFQLDRTITHVLAY